MTHTSHTHTHTHSHTHTHTHTPAECSTAAALLLKPALSDGILLHLKEHQHIVTNYCPATYPALSLVALVLGMIAPSVS